MFVLTLPLALLVSCTATLPSHDALLVSVHPSHAQRVTTHAQALGAKAKDLGLDGWLEVTISATRSGASDISSFLERRLKQLPGVKLVRRSKEQVVSQRWLFSEDTVTHGPVSFNDPKWSRMWYWNETSAMNVYGAWDTHRLTGRGTTIAVLDDGVDVQVSDLTHYSTSLSYDYVTDTTDPGPSTGQVHGTKVAGVALGKANNNFCGFGVAYEATLVAVRLLTLFGGISEARQVKSLVHNDRHLHVDAFVASWGAKDDGQQVDKPEDLVHLALAKASKYGKNGAGSVVVVAAGNGGEIDDCQADGYVTDRYTLAVQAVSQYNTAPFFTEHCSAALTSVYIGRGLVAPSTRWARDLCVENFEGTSAAAPTLGGIIALVREAYPSVTRRDILHLVVHSSQSQLLRDTALKPMSEEVAKVTSNDTALTQWTTNAAGLHFHPHFGFGLIDVEKLLQEAGSGRYNHPNYHEEFCNSTSTTKLYDSAAIFNTRDCGSLSSLEYVTVVVSVQASKRGALEMFLTSAQGTRIRLLSTRPNDFNTEFFEWKFTTPAFWDEAPLGAHNWKIEFVATEGSTLATNWTASLILYGVPFTYPTTSSTTSTTTSTTTSATTSRTTSPTTTTRRTRSTTRRTSTTTAAPSGGTEIQITNCYGEQVSSSDQQQRLVESTNGVTLLHAYNVPLGTTIHAIRVYATKAGTIDLLLWEMKAIVFAVLVSSKTDVYIPGPGYHEIEIQPWVLPSQSENPLRFGFSNHGSEDSVIGYVVDGSKSVHEKPGPFSPDDGAIFFLTSPTVQKAYYISFCTGVEITCNGPPNIEKFSANKIGPTMYLHNAPVGSSQHSKAVFYTNGPGKILLIAVEVPNDFLYKVKSNITVNVTTNGKQEVDITSLGLGSRDLFGFIYQGSGDTPILRSEQKTATARVLKEQYVPEVKLGVPLVMGLFETVEQASYALKAC